MAAPTKTEDFIPCHTIDITGTNVDAGNNDYVLDYVRDNLSNGFSIITGTLTAMTVTLLAYNKSGVLVDVTNAILGAATLASDSAYKAVAGAVPYKNLLVRAARTNATNAVAFTVFAPRR